MTSKPTQTARELICPHCETKSKTDYNYFCSTIKSPADGKLLHVMTIECYEKYLEKELSRKTELAKELLKAYKTICEIEFGENDESFELIKKAEEELNEEKE